MHVMIIVALVITRVNLFNISSVNTSYMETFLFLSPPTKAISALIETSSASLSVFLSFG